MSKLYKLREWLTLDESAKHLSLFFGEEVSVSDILRMALDDHLKISINFVNYGKAIKGRIIPHSDAIYHKAHPFVLDIIKDIRGGKNENLTDEDLSVMEGIRLTENEVLKLETSIFRIEGIWDLLMLGAERLDVEHEFQQLTGGPEITLEDMNGTFVRSPYDEKIVCQLQERFSKEEIEQYKGTTLTYDNPRNYFPAGGLPQDSTLVIRTDALKELIESISDTNEKKLATKTKNAYLKTIHSLSEALTSGLTGTKNKDAAAILKTLELKGIPHPVSQKTLADYLEEAKELQ